MSWTAHLCRRINGPQRATTFLVDNGGGGLEINGSGGKPIKIEKMIDSEIWNELKKAGNQRFAGSTFWKHVEDRVKEDDTDLANFVRDLKVGWQILPLNGKQDKMDFNSFIETLTKHHRADTAKYHGYTLAALAYRMCQDLMKGNFPGYKSITRVLHAQTGRARAIEHREFL